MCKYSIFQATLSKLVCLDGQCVTPIFQCRSTIVIAKLEWSWTNFKTSLHKDCWLSQEFIAYSNLILKSGLLESVVWVKVSTLQAPVHFWKASAMSLCRSPSDNHVQNILLYNTYIKSVLDQDLAASYLLKRLAPSSTSGSLLRGFFIWRIISSSTSPDLWQMGKRLKFQS